MKHYDTLELSKYFDGEIKGAQALEISKHVEECSECRSILNEYEDIRKRTASSEISHSEFLYAKITGRIDFRAEARRRRGAAFVFAMLMILVFTFSFAFTMKQERVLYEKRTADNSDRIADDFITGISPSPSGSLTSLVNYGGR